MTERLWSNKKTGKLVTIYENELPVYVRGQVKHLDDVSQCGHFQMDGDKFNKDYKLIGSITKPKKVVVKSSALIYTDVQSVPITPRKQDDYEIVIWSGDSGCDVEFVDGGKTLVKAKRILKETKIKYPDRDVSLRLWFNDGSSDNVD